MQLGVGAAGRRSRNNRGLSGVLPQHREDAVVVSSAELQLPSVFTGLLLHWQQCLVWAGQFARPPAFDRGRRREIVLGWSVLRLLPCLNGILF